MNYIKPGIILFSIIFISLLSSPAFGDNLLNNSSSPDLTVLTFPTETETAYYLNGSIGLVQGWNFISVPRRLAEDSYSALIFSGINSSGRSIWTYNPSEGGWHSLSIDDKIIPMEGYWVYSDSPVSIQVNYSSDPLQVPPVKELVSGWNVFGFTGNNEASARDSLLSISSLWTQLIGWDENNQRYDTSIINEGSNGQSDSRLLLPYHSYWIYVNESCSLASIGA